MTETYQVASARGCKVITGSVPVSDFCALVKVWTELQDEGDKWIADSLLAAALGANAVFGPKSACLAWRSSLGIE